MIEARVWVTWECEFQIAIANAAFSICYKCGNCRECQSKLTSVCAYKEWRQVVVWKPYSLPAELVRNLNHNQELVGCGSDFRTRIWNRTEIYKVPPVHTWHAWDDTFDGIQEKWCFFLNKLMPQNWNCCKFLWRHDSKKVTRGENKP